MTIRIIVQDWKGRCRSERRFGCQMLSGYGTGTCERLWREHVGCQCWRVWGTEMTTIHCVPGAVQTDGSEQDRTKLEIRSWGRCYGGITKADSLFLLSTQWLRDSVTKWSRGSKICLSRQCGPCMARLPGFSQLVHCSEDGIDEALKGLEVPDAKWLGATSAWLGKGFRWARASVNSKHLVLQKEIVSPTEWCKFHLWLRPGKH